MNKLDQIRSLDDRINNDMSMRKDGQRELFLLELTKAERNLIADALNVLYGYEAKYTHSRIELDAAH
jgi:hypothetical protein